MRTMRENTLPADSPQTATAGMRAMPQGVVGGARTRTPEEAAFLEAGDRLREVRRRLDAMARRWRAGHPDATPDACNAVQAEYRSAQAEYFRCRALAVASVRSLVRRGGR